MLFALTPVTVTAVSLTPIPAIRLFSTEKPLKELGWDHLELDQKTGFFVLNQAAPSPNDQLPSTLRKLGTQVQSAPRVKH